jgi:hypothetical protein
MIESLDSLEKKKFTLKGGNHSFYFTFLPVSDRLGKAYLVIVIPQNMILTIPERLNP